MKALKKKKKKLKHSGDQLPSKYSIFSGNKQERIQK